MLNRPYVIFSLYFTKSFPVHGPGEEKKSSENEQLTGNFQSFFFRVGSHVVFAWIHCTDVRIHYTDILIECR